MSAPKEISDKALRQVLKKASKRAVDETFAMGLPIVIARSGKLVKVYPDGGEEVIKSLGNKPRKIKRKRFRIGA